MTTQELTGAIQSTKLDAWNKKIRWRRHIRIWEGQNITMVREVSTEVGIVTIVEMLRSRSGKVKQ